MYKEALTLNNYQLWICHKTKSKPITIYLIFMYKEDLECSPMIRETGVQSQVESYQRLKKWFLMPHLLNTQHYKERIKVIVEQYRARINTLPYTSE